MPSARKKVSGLCSQNEYKELQRKCWEEIRDLHFGENGSPYWVKKAKHFGIDYRKDLPDLESFLMQEISVCDERDLKEKPEEYFIPEKTLKEKPVHRMTSSGSTTGEKKVSFWTDEGLSYNAKHLAKVAKLYGVKEGMKWVVTGPSYPAPFEPLMEKLVLREMRGDLYFVPVETEQLKKKIAELPQQELTLEKLLANPYFEARLGPVWRETVKYLNTRKVNFLGTTLFMLPDLEKQKGFENIKFVYVGGMEIPKEAYKFWKARLEEQGKKLITSYGHYIFGLFFDLPNAELTYYSAAPQSFLYVTEEQDLFKLVKYGERGRIRYLKMDEAMLWCQQERDFAQRVKPNEYFSWDGAKQIEAKF